MIVGLRGNVSAMFVRTVRRVVWVSAIAAMVNGSWLVSEIRNPFGPEHLRRLPLAHGMFRRNRAIPVAEALRDEVRRRARNSNARLHYGAAPGLTLSEALARKLVLTENILLHTIMQEADEALGRGRHSRPGTRPPDSGRMGSSLVARWPADSDRLTNVPAERIRAAHSEKRQRCRHRNLLTSF